MLVSVKIVNINFIFKQENGLDDELWQISLNAGTREKLESAKYFEAVDPNRAVVLYQKAENFLRALHLAFKYVELL